eukprot:CAMPEP_0174263070 /NCGR_PEP_ID=MMETSP0439-20130205/17053_1 /TAXON_ID=0 /ORGANISM="Stereomyxa ramosa, Strain Chinc5" /LENGTH=533 /DNA_ID=CAMNT_0015348203 /DNA_START=130 /DNA_END=1731 /DNA_ORIENTATION=-
MKESEQGSINFTESDKLLTGKEEPKTCCGCCSKKVYKWLVLWFIMWLTFGSYWVFDTPGAIFVQLQDWFGGEDKYTSAMNLNLYSVYSYPNVILCFFGGIIIDKWTGVRFGAILFCGFILLGEVLFAIGIQVKQYYVCLVGRLIFGLGGENLTVAQNTYTAKWFGGEDGRDLALAFGLVLSFARIGSSVNFVVTPYLSAVGVPLAVWFGAGTCFLSFCCCLVLGIIDFIGDKMFGLSEALKEGEKKTEETISWAHVKAFPLSLYIIYFICMFFYIGVLTFNTVASDIMQNTGAKFDKELATVFLSIPNFVSVVLAPTFGRIIDRMGRTLLWILISCIMLVTTHLGFLGNANDWWQIHPVILLLWLGVGYSMFAASIWPCLPYIIPDIALGTAYGAMTAVQNLGLAVFPQIIGNLQGASGIKDNSLKYTLPILIFIACAGIAFFLALFLTFWDKAREAGILNASGAQRQALRDEKFGVEEDEIDEGLKSHHELTIGLDDEPILEVRPEHMPRLDHRTRYLYRLGIQGYRPKEFL